MKNLFITVLGCTMVLGGCDLDEPDIDPQRYIYGQWELLNQEAYGRNGPTFSETYVFREGGDFEKNRISDESHALAKGVFSVEETSSSDDGALVKLEYLSGEQQLRNGCAEVPNVEWLVLSKDGSLNSKVEISCQAPFLLYEKIMP